MRLYFTPLGIFSAWTVVGLQRPWREGKQTSHTAWSTGLGSKLPLTAINDTVHQRGSFSKPQFSDLQNGNNDLIRIRGANHGTHSSVLAWRIPGTGSLVGYRLWVTQSRT